MLGLHPSSSKDRRYHGHGHARGPVPLGGRPISPCTSRDGICGRERFGQDTPVFEPRRGTFLGGLAPGPMGGLAGLGALGGMGLYGPVGGGLGIPFVGGLGGCGYGNEFEDNFGAGGGFGGTFGGGLRNGVDSGLGGLRNGYRRRLSQLYDFENPMTQLHSGGIPRSPLLDPRLHFFDERSLAGYRREDPLGSPLALGSRENLLRGRMALQVNPLSPLASRAASIRSGRSGGGMELDPRMSGGLGGGGGIGNYRAPYVEDYESEADEYERVLREMDLVEQADGPDAVANYFYGAGDDLGPLRGRL